MGRRGKWQAGDAEVTESQKYGQRNIDISIEKKQTCVSAEGFWHTMAAFRGRLGPTVEGGLN